MHIDQETKTCKELKKSLSINKYSPDSTTVVYSADLQVIWVQFLVGGSFCLWEERREKEDERIRNSL